jgi:hypothetical protein
MTRKKSKRRAAKASKRPMWPSIRQRKPASVDSTVMEVHAEKNDIGSTC